MTGCKRNYFYFDCVSYYIIHKMQFFLLMNKDD